MRVKRAQGRFRQSLREVMEPYAGGADASWLSLVVDVIVLGSIIASCTLVVVEWMHPDLASSWHRAEVFFTTLFVLEYLLRWYSAENRWLYPFKPIAILDLVAILPGLLMLGPDMLMLRAVRGARMLRLLRLLRLVRLLRLFRYGSLIFRSLVQARIWLSSVVFQYRLGELGRLFLWTLVALFVGANVLHLTEVAVDEVDGPFDGYWQSYWNIVIVLMSGIEDKEPLSLAGRIEVIVLLIAGLVIVGMLTAEIVAILVRRAQRHGKLAVKPPRGRFEGHVVILGTSAHIDNIVRQVNAALKGHHHILIVDPEADDLPITDSRLYSRVFALAGDPLQTRILEQADLDSAARIIILAPEVEPGCEGTADNKTLMAMVAASGRAGGIPMVVELLDEDSMRFTRSLSEIDFIVGRLFGERMASQAVLNPGVTEVYDELLTFTEESNEIYTIAVPDDLVGKLFSDAQLFFLDRDDLEITIIGIDRSPAAWPSSEFFLCPTAEESGLTREETTLCEGDNLIVIAYEKPVFADSSDPWAPASLSRM